MKFDQVSGFSDT